jgi:hypothetical protein
MKILSNYLEFLLEAVSKQEMRIYYSDEFRNILKNMSQSSIAQSLLTSEDDEQTLDIYTLIDITEKNDTISLIQVNRITRGNPELGEKLPYNIRDKKSGSEFWDKARTEMKIGRWVKRIFTEIHKNELSDVKVEEFVNLYKSIIDGGVDNFELVEGEDIRKWYLEKNYESRKGELGNSCMRHMSCQPYLDIYVKNPDVCKLLILRSKSDPDRIIGRALIWKLENGEYYMDRIYTINNSDQVLYDNWANSKKMKTYRRLDHIISVQLGDFEYKTYPYMDTFSVYSRVEKKLSSDEDLWPNGYIKIEETDGGFISDEVVWSEYLKENLPVDDAQWCDDIKDYFYLDEAIYLEYKSIHVANAKNVVYSYYEGGYFYKEDLVWSNVMKSWIEKNDNVLIKIISNEDGDEDWCTKDEIKYYIEYKGSYYVKNNLVIDPYTNEIVWRNSDSASDLFYRIIEDLGKEDNFINYNTLSFDDLKFKATSERRIGIIYDAIELYLKNKEKFVKGFEKEIESFFSDYVTPQNSVDRVINQLLEKCEIEDIPIIMLAMLPFDSNDYAWWSKTQNILKKYNIDSNSLNWSVLDNITKISLEFDWSLLGDGINKRVILFRLVNNY